MSQYKFTIDADATYPDGIPQARPGYEIIGYRLPKLGELIMCTDGSTYAANENTVAAARYPVLLAQKIVKKVYTFRNTGQKRCPDGEWVHRKGSFILMNSNQSEEIWELTVTEE